LTTQLFACTATFAAKEQEQLTKSKLLAKDCDELTPGQPLQFNSGLICHFGDHIMLTQENICQKIRPVSKKPQTLTNSRGEVRNNLSVKDQFVAQRATGAYVAGGCQPESAYGCSVAAQATDPTDTDVDELNKTLLHISESGSRGLKFVKLSLNSIRILVFTDASFANNKDLSSQIGYVLVIADEDGNANIVYWTSIKCKRVTRAVLA
jgi:hypothetical protein